MARTLSPHSRRGSIAVSLLGCAAMVSAYGVLTLGGASVSFAASQQTQHQSLTATGTKIGTRTTGLGLIAVGASKRTVYMFTRDSAGVSRCGSTCRQSWPRVRTDGKPVAGTGIKQSKLGQTSKHQVTYYGHPLYYYAGDHATAGNTRGQGRTAFNGRWWVLGHDGKAGTGALLRMHATADGAAVAGPLGSGRTLYMLSSDGATHATCTGSCATSWPALYSVGKPRAGSGITASLIRTFVRGNGQRQVTYNGHPLYYYAGDSAAGQDNGKCIYQGPGTWYFLNASGKAVQGPCSATPPPTSGSPPCDTKAPATATISVSASTKSNNATSLGNVLQDSRGCTVYLYNPDPAGTATVNSATWPPVTSAYAPIAGDGLNCTLATTATANAYDGATKQVTCHGHPLYYYAPDHQTADATGEGSLGLWYVLDHNGDQVA